MNKIKLNRDLLCRLKNGDILAFDFVYKFYFHKLYGFVLKYIKQEEDAKGIVQEVFIKIWESRERIDTYSSFDSFIFTIAYNATISQLRKRINEQKYLEDLRNRQQIENAEEIINDIHYRELSNNVEVLLNGLTPRQKEVFLLSRRNGLTHTEIAKKLNISVNTVKNHLVTSLKYLKSNLNKDLIINVFLIALFIS